MPKKKQSKVKHRQKTSALEIIRKIDDWNEKNRNGNNAMLSIILSGCLQPLHCRLSIQDLQKKTKMI